MIEQTKIQYQFTEHLCNFDQRHFTMSLTEDQALRIKELLPENVTMDCWSNEPEVSYEDYLEELRMLLTSDIDYREWLEEDGVELP